MGEPFDLERDVAHAEYLHDDTVSDQEAFELDVQKLLRIVQFVLKHGQTDLAGYPRALLNEAAANVEAWYDNENDPRSMGWVNDRGQP